MTEQLALFNFAPKQVIKSVVDPYWDEIECGKVDLVNSNQIHDDLDGLLSPSQLPESAHQHKAGTPCNCVGEQVNNGTHADTVHFLVGEQVESDTKKTAHQHDRQTTQHQKFTHWVEKYWVERSGHKHWYYRYAWMHGRKINRIYIGSAQSAIAKNRKSEIETAIADGESPADIQRLLKPQS
jgi:hypothetical protein